MGDRASGNVTRLSTIKKKVPMMQWHKLHTFCKEMLELSLFLRRQTQGHESSDNKQLVACMSYWKSGSENGNKQKGNICARMQLHSAVQSANARTTTTSDYQATNTDTIWFALIHNIMRWWLTMQMNELHNNLVPCRTTNIVLTTNIKKNSTQLSQQSSQPASKRSNDLLPQIEISLNTACK